MPDFNCSLIIAMKSEAKKIVFSTRRHLVDSHSTNDITLTKAVYITTQNFSTVFTPFSVFDVCHVGIIDFWNYRAQRWCGASV
jgi:hypothetical protein